MEESADNSAKSAVSIIIPTRNRPALLERCLGSLASGGVFSSGVHAFVCDDFSEEANRVRNKALCERDGVTYILCEGRGPAAARNRGIAASDSQWCAFIDDDAIVAPEWLGTLIDTVRICSPYCIGIEGSVFPEGDGLWDHEVMNLDGGLFITANMVWRRSALELAGMFDEDFPGPFAEDHELSVRMERYGFTVFVPRMRAYHASRKLIG